jgi:hypothetical protein
MWKKKEEKKGEKEEDLLKELCGNDTKMYDLLSQSLYLDPKAAISRTDLNILVQEAEKSVGDEDYQEAMQKYRKAVDQAIFEATQNPGEMSRYIKVIQDLVSKTAKVTEKRKEEREKEGLARSSLEERIIRYEFICQRTEDVIKIASLYYNERLEELGAIEGREARRGARIESERQEERGEKEAKERRESRGKEMGRREKKEAEREDKAEEKKEKERGETRRKERIEAETEENGIEEREKETREARRKEK